MPQFPPEIESLYEELRKLQQRENEIRQEIEDWFSGVSQTLQELGLEPTEKTLAAPEVTIEPSAQREETGPAAALRATLTGHESQRQTILAALAATRRGMRAAEINELLQEAGMDEIPEANIRALLSKSSKEGVVEWVRQGVYKLPSPGELESEERAGSLSFLNDSPLEW